MPSTTHVTSTYLQNLYISGELFGGGGGRGEDYHEQLIDEYHEMPACVYVQLLTDGIVWVRMTLHRFTNVDMCE